MSVYPPTDLNMQNRQLFLPRACLLFPWQGSVVKKQGTVAYFT